MSQLMRRVTAVKAVPAGEPSPDLRRARLATATLFFANGCGLGSWVPHIPVVKIRHGLSEGELGLALLVIAAGAVAALPTAPAGDVGPLFVLPRGNFVVLGAIAFVALLAEGAMGDWSAVYIRMSLGAAASTAAYGFAAFSLAMAIGRFTGDRLVARHGTTAVLAGGALIGACSLGVALIAGHPLAAVAGFTGMGLGLSNIIPIVFSAAGRLPGLAPGIGIAAVSTTGYFGYLAGPPLIGLVAEASSLPIGLGLVAVLVSLIVVGVMTLQRPRAPVAVLGG